MSYMMSSSFVTSIIPISCKAVMSLMGALSGPVASLFFIFFNACSTSSAKIREPSIPLLTSHFLNFLMHVFAVFDGLFFNLNALIVNQRFYCASSVISI